mgnify:FL=1
MKKVLFVVTGLLLVFVMSACGEGTPEADQHDVEDIKQYVHEYSVGNFTDVSASISSHELIVTDEDESETTYPLPEDEFFVSIAPFETETHPCAIHSLTGCQGEMVEKEFEVYIEDEDGNVLVDETMTSLENGFLDIWLPRDRTYQVMIEHEGKKSESEISTFDGDNTCITTMQLI